VNTWLKNWKHLIQPKLSARAKEMSEAQGSVARDGARSVQDLRDAIGRHVDLPRQFSRALQSLYDLRLAQEKVGKSIKALPTLKRRELVHA
jgi:hypothetical protein